jgi:uncharacterized protein (TIRG00374 family)
MWVSYGTSALAIALAVRFFNFGGLGAALASARLVWVVPAAAILLVTMCLRSLRWSLLMGRSPLGVTFHALNIGYMMNVLLPFRLGEVARAYVMGERSPVTMARALSAIVLERVLDLACVVLILVFSAQFVPLPPLFRHTALVGAIAVVVVVVASATLVWQARRAEVLLRKTLSKISDAAADRWSKRLIDLCDGFRAVGSARSVLASLALTIAIWTNVLVSTWVMMEMFIDARLDEATLVLAATNLSSAIPSGPGGIGVIQAFARTALVAPFHVPEDRALAFVLVYTFGPQLLTVVLGIVGLARVGMSFGQAARSPKASPAG